MPETTTADKKQIAKIAINHDLSCRQIAAITGIGKTRVAEIISEVKDSQDYKQFTGQKDKIFENLQYKLVNLADDELLKTMLSKRGFTDVAILQDKIQALRGEPVSVTEHQIRVILDGVVGKVEAGGAIEADYEQLPSTTTESNNPDDLSDIDKLMITSS